MNVLPDILSMDSDLDYVESQDDIGNMLCSLFSISSLSCVSS